MNNNYKLIKFNKKSFSDTFLGSDIGIHSKGFNGVAIISTLLSVSLLVIMYFTFKI